MSKLPPKMIAILLGIVFFLGGATTVSAAMPDQWAFEYKMSPGFLVQLGSWFNPTGVTAPEIANLIKSYGTQAACTAGQSAWASDSDYVITKSCYQITVTDLVAAQAVMRQSLQAANLEGDPLLKNLHCDITNGVLGHGRLADCFPIVIYYVVYKPASYLLMGSGYIFDKMLTFSIDSTFINQGFIDSSWATVRDFSNMLFIFILIFTGVQTILGAKDWRGTVIKVVIMALLINFSLFFTKVVIDAGNVLAVGIKGMISPSGQSISAGLVKAFEPQSFLSAAGKADAMDTVVIFLIASVVSGFAGYILFKAALLFARRLVVFWALMILSPFAFISIALPAKANKFRGWLDELTGQAFAAPIFLFFIYLIAQVISAGGGLLNGFMQVGSWFQSLIGPIIVATLLIKALQEALKYTEDFAGTTGAAFSGLVAGAMGLATGGVALAGQKVIGGAANQALKRGWVSPDSRAGAAAKFATKASFDVRNVGGAVGNVVGKVAGEHAGKWVGGKVTQGVGAMGIGAGIAAGGVAATTKAAADKQKAKDKAAKNKAEIPMLKTRLATMKAAFSTLQAQNGDTVDPATGAVLTQGSALKNDLTAKENALTTADLTRQGNPSDPALIAAHASALNNKKTAEKILKKYEAGEDDIEKLEKQIEGYESL